MNQAEWGNEFEWRFGIPIKPAKETQLYRGIMARRDLTAPFKCKGCDVEKPMKDFYVSRKSVRSHFASLCATCRKIQLICRNRKITVKQYKWLMDQWDGRCSVCLLECKPHLDHCHATGSMRGFLCTSCNSALGLLRDDVAVMARAIDYLKRAPVVLPSI